MSVEFATLIVRLSDESIHRIRVEGSILRARKNDIYAIAFDQQQQGNLPDRRIVNVRHAFPGE
jgi:hypothetical protein